MMMMVMMQNRYIIFRVCLWWSHSLDPKRILWGREHTQHVFLSLPHYHQDYTQLISWITDCDLISYVDSYQWTSASHFQGYLLLLHTASQGWYGSIIALARWLHQSLVAQLAPPTRHPPNSPWVHREWNTPTGWPARQQHVHQWMASCLRFVRDGGVFPLVFLEEKNKSEMWKNDMWYILRYLVIVISCNYKVLAWYSHL